MLLVICMRCYLYQLLLFWWQLLPHKARQFHICQEPWLTSHLLSMSLHPYSKRYPEPQCWAALFLLQRNAKWSTIQSIVGCSCSASSRLDRMTLTASPKQHFCVPKPLSCSQPLRQEQRTKHSNCRDTGYIPLRGLLRNIASYGFRNPAYLILWWPCSSPQLPTQRSFRENYFQNKKK